ncbi:hypothetical protein [Clostridium baratii]|uniref:hypothetical protein n=1 Tax=Clostridium baratii TaxID=1561 RepID=UPI0030D1540F
MFKKIKEKKINKKEVKNKKREEKKAEKLKKKKEKEELRKVHHTTKELLPLCSLTENENSKCKEEYLDIFQIESMDINAMNDYDVRGYILSLTNLFKLYLDDIKIISMNFPANTQVQQNYVSKKIKECKNEVHLKFLKERLRQLEAIERIRTNREYYIMIYGATEEELEKNKATLISSSASIKINEIGTEKKIKILKKLNNMNSKI